MADEKQNQNNEPLSDSGDVLGQASGKASNPDKLLRSIEQSAKSMEKSTKSMQQQIAKLVQQNQNSNSSNFRASVDSARHSGSNSEYPKSSFTSSAASKAASSFKINPEKYLDPSAKNAVEKAMDGFEETLCDYLGIPYIGDNVQESISNNLNKWAENLAGALDVSASNLPKELSKKLTQQKLESNPKWAQATKKIADWYKSGFSDVKSAAEKAWNDAVSQMDDKDLAKKLRAENIFGNGSSESSFPQRATVSSNNVSNSLMDAVNYWWDIYDEKEGFDNGNLSSDWKPTTDWMQRALGVEDKGPAIADSAVDDAKGKVAQGALEAMSTKDVRALVTGVKGAAGSLIKMAPQLAAAAAVSAVVEGITNEIGELASRLNQAADKLTSGANKWDETRWANVQAQEKRMQQDMEEYVKYPFKILEDAAQKVYDVWDSALQTINATQGYTKSDLQDLMTAYASRLRSEGLSSVVGTTDVTSMLQSIINQGLSGKVAEEFAYQATVLNKAIPTEDFASYASSYASLASSYMQQGHTQSEALEYANSQLQLFASNVLNASRQVSGGFTTSLTNVSGLFDNIVKISETAGTSNTASLSSALSVVQAVAGRVSPEVGNSLVSQIVSAAVGGNDSNLVALRSLAGTGASNTAFLKALASNPSQVLANMFSGLQSMFDKSTDNYMEVAYSLADTFGVSADALARINWQTLVDELKNNSSSNSSLNENMKLLASGETTTSAESQRLSQINQYMIDQGLSYVLDNEEARSIQQHMWDQEIAQQMQEATYAIDFAGGALEAMTAIEGFLENIFRFITGGPVVGISQSAIDYASLTSDIKNILEAGKVGSGNATQLHDLTTYDVNSLSYIPNASELWGLSSNYYGSYWHQSQHQNYQSEAIDASSPSSKYAWAAGKSALSALSQPQHSPDLPGINSATASSTIASNTAQSLSTWLGSMGDYASSGKSFQDWYNSARDYGFSDVSSALDEAGYTTQDLQQAYVSSITDNAIAQQSAASQLEYQFYQDGITFLESTEPSRWEEWNNKYDTNVSAWLMTYSTSMTDWSALYSDTMTSFTEHLDSTYKSWTDLYLESQEETHKNQKYINNAFDESFINDYLYEWKDYYIGNHTHYREATNFDSSLRTINSEKVQTGEAVLALAKTLTQNYEDLADPAVQTNVLLGQIVILLQSIFTAQQSGNGLTLPTSLAALGLNITTAQSK